MPKTTVAIVGKPNVGKSTLFNCFVGRHAAITEGVPGVTRDRIYGSCEWIDKTFAVIDTGGLMPDSDDPLISAAQTQTQLALEEADVIVCLLDSQEELTATDHEIVRQLRQTTKPVLYVANKIDSERHQARLADFYQLGLHDVIPISAEHRLGIDVLLDAICEHVAPPDAEDATDAPLMRIAVVGRPNVGKSSFVNYLLGEERMLVTDIAGTTRDAIDSHLTHDGVQYLLVDTAGIRRRSKIFDPVEHYSVVRAFKSIDRCHLALVLLDAVSGVTDQDARIAGYAHNLGRAIILVVNKWDLVEKNASTTGEYVEQLKLKLNFLDYAPIIFTSALTGQRVMKTLTLAQNVFEQYNQRVATADLNAVLEDIVAKHHPPTYRSREVKIYYGTQVAVRPPTFVLFSNAPEGLKPSYKQYLINQLRERFHLPETPIKLRIQPR